MSSNDHPRDESPKALIMHQLEALAALRSIAGRANNATRATAIAVIGAQATALAIQAAQVGPLTRELDIAREAGRDATNAARYITVMAYVLRDLTRLFPLEELGFEATDEGEHTFRITGYEPLDLSFNFTFYHGEVRNRAMPSRKSRRLYVDEAGLTVDAFVNIEALFGVRLTRSNTPRRIHRELFSDPEPNPGLVALIESILDDIPSCGNRRCRLHNGDLARAIAGGPSQLCRFNESLDDFDTDTCVTLLPFGSGRGIVLGGFGDLSP